MPNSGGGEFLSAKCKMNKWGALNKLEVEGLEPPPQILVAGWEKKAIWFLSYKKKNFWRE